MSERGTFAEGIRSPAASGSLQLVRLPADKPQVAVSFLHARSQGVMDLIAHFWERLPQTPPLQRADLHLVVGVLRDSTNSHMNTSEIDVNCLSGAMLYVPKAHRADVLALDALTAAAFCAYIGQRGSASLKPDPIGAVVSTSGAVPPVGLVLPGLLSGSGLSFMDLSNGVRGGGIVPAVELAVDPIPMVGSGERVPIDFLTGHADGIEWMVPLLLPLVHRKAPARQLVNVVMELASEGACAADENVRIARQADLPALNRWRRQYREERGILFDADLDAWVDTGKVFVYEHEKEVVAVAKFDLELPRRIEIGGVYTFPEHRKHGFGRKIVSDLAARIRQAGKMPTLQVDAENVPALRLYEGAGWKPMGRLGRVWLTG